MRFTVQLSIVQYTPTLVYIAVCSRGAAESQRFNHRGFMSVVYITVYVHVCPAAVSCVAVFVRYVYK